MANVRFDIEFASHTDVGLRRSHNQDSHAMLSAADPEQWQQRGHVLVVADGMGAHAVGELASNALTKVVFPAPLRPISAILSPRIMLAVKSRITFFSS